MQNLPPTQNVLQKLAILCRKKEVRINRPLVDIPNNWNPMAVTHPATLSTFTDDGAWDFIAECLTSGVPVRHKPPSMLMNDNAYELIHAPEGGSRRIYMKIALMELSSREVPSLGEGKKVTNLVGVSFHYERHP